MDLAGGSAGVLLGMATAEDPELPFLPFLCPLDQLLDRDQRVGGHPQDLPSGACVD
jgi:hypothetical protein